MQIQSPEHSLAREAAQLPEHERERFLLQHINDDPDRLALIRNLVAEILAMERRHAAILDSIDPFTSIDPFATNATDPLEAARQAPPESDDAIAATVSLPENQTPESESQAVISEAAFLTLSGSDQSKVQDACTQFRAAWKSDQPPSLDQFLPNDWDRELREYLAIQLILIDVEEREKRNQIIQEKDYLSRLPDCRSAVKKALTKKTESARRYKDTGTEPNAGLDSDDSGEWLLEENDANSLRYRPLKMHARGGLGAVYRAKDMELGRTVALKRILPSHEHNPRSKSRFVFEAEVTGSLEHPGIVPVYGLGCFGDDQPYYAMRFIRGRSLSDDIKAFHQANPNPSTQSYDDREFRQLLRRVIDVCNAIHYAHERGVLHRDIKSDNVMLGRYGETLVVDWGLAKRWSLGDAADEPEGIEINLPPALSQRPTDTSLGYAVGTPMFMSPEQAIGRHDELTPASDVYSIGAMLFRMIAGQSPIEGKTTRDVLSNVRKGNVRDLGLIVPTAPKALVSICKKSMLMNPHDRYATAIALADDLDRWMNDELVGAHADHETHIEKAGRLIRRYRSWTISGAIALLLITFVAILAALLIQRAKRNEEIAKLQAVEFKGEAVARYRDSRNAIDTWLVQSSDALEFFPGTQSVRKRLLTLAVEDYATLAKSKSDDPDLELERGRAMIRLGDLTQVQQSYGEAREHYRAAISLLSQETDQLLQDNGPNEELKAIFDAEAGHARSRLALAYASEESYVDADQEYRSAIATLQKIHDETSNPTVTRYLATAQVNAGELYVIRDDIEQATTLLQAGLESFLTMGEAVTSRDRLGIARTEELLGRLEAHQGKHDDAIKRFDVAIDRLKSLITEEPDHPDFLDAIASTFISQSTSHRVLGLHREERTALESAVTHYRELCRAMPDVPRYEENLALTLTDLGIALYEADHCRDAASVLREAEKLIGSLIEAYGVLPKYYDQKAACQDALSQALLGVGEWAGAKEHSTASVAAYHELRSAIPDRPDYAERLGTAQSHLAQAIAATANESDSNDKEALVKAAGEEFGAASKILAELTEAFPEISRYQSSLAHIHFQEGLFWHDQDDPKAAERFGDACRIWSEMADDRTPVDCERLAWVLTTCPEEKIRDAVEAIRLATLAVEASPGNRLFRCTLSLARMVAGDGIAAKRALTEASVNRETPNAIETRTGREWLVLSHAEQMLGNSEAASQASLSADTWIEDQCPNLQDIHLIRSLFDED